MFFFPLLNFLFLIILYRIHRGVFWVTTVIEVIVHIVGFWYIYSNYGRADNQLLYTFTLTGVGFIIVLLAFVIAIFHNYHRDIEHG